MKDKAHGVVDLAPKFQWEAMGKGTALLWGSKAVFCNKECGDGNEISVILSQVGKGQNPCSQSFSY